MAKPTSLARGTVLGIFAQVWQLLTAFALYRYLFVHLGPAGFGQWRVTLSILNYVEMLVVSGLVQVAAKRLAEDPDDAPRIERGAYLAQMTLAFSLFIALEATAGFIAAALRTPYLAPLIRIAALDIPVVAAFALAGNLHLGRQDFSRQVTGMFVYATAKFVAIFGLVWLGLSLPGAFIGNAIASVVGFAVLFTPWQGTGVRMREALDEARGMGLAAVPFLTQSLVSGISSDADLWFVQAVKGSSSAGLYGGAAALAETTSFLFAALSRVLFPSVARAGAQDDDWLVARYATQGVRLALLVCVLGVGVIAATGGAALVFVYKNPVVALAALPFTVLMVASTGRNVRATCSDVMMARGQRRQVLTILIVTTIADIALLALITPAYGQLGAAVAAAVTAVIAGVAASWEIRRLLGLRVVWTLLRSSIAAAVVGLGLWLLRPAGIWLIPAYVAGAVLYVALLWALREFDSDDIASMRRAVARAG